MHLRTLADVVNGRANPWVGDHVRWEIQLETKCEHDCSCFNGYRDLCCRKAIYAMWFPPNEMLPGTNQTSIPVAQVSCAGGWVYVVVSGVYQVDASSVNRWHNNL